MNEVLTLSDRLAWLFGRGAYVVPSTVMAYLLGSGQRLDPVEAYHRVWAVGVANWGADVECDAAGVPLVISFRDSAGLFPLFTVQFIRPGEGGQGV